MIFRQVTHDDLGCASYLVGDGSAGVVAVVDPRLDIEVYLDLERYLGVRIEHILETHNHADHVSGHGRLASATGATIHVHRDADVGYEHEPFDDGWELALGSVRVRALHTPGHRPEHTSFVLVDTARGPEPWAVLTGDSLFVGDVARPDLAVEKREGARGIFRSIHERLLPLGPETEIWPGHLGGSLCGGPGMDMKVSSTVGYERRHNELVAEGDESAFVEQAVAGLAPQPPNFAAIVELNRGPLLTDAIEVPPLSAYQVDELRSRGAIIVDARASEEFDAAHIPGAVSIPATTAGFGTQLAWVADLERDLVLVGRDDDEAVRAAGLAASVGLRQVAGRLTGGMSAWHSEGRTVEPIERVDVPELHLRTEGDPSLQVLDVREEPEWDAGHIPGSTHRPYHDITDVPDAIDPHRPVAVICASGQRSAVAASLVKRHGAHEVIHVVDGGVPEWERSGWPIERGDSAAQG